jgi:hypothetical protein
MAAINWAAGISGNWSLASNWNGGMVPTGFDNVTIDAAGSYTINVDHSYSTNTLIFNAPGATINIPTGLALDPLHGTTITGVTLGTGLTFYNYPGGSLSLNAPINIGDAAGATATIINGSTFNLLSDAAGVGVNPSGAGDFQNNATLAKTGGTGTSHIAASVTSSGTVSVTTGTLEFDGPSNTLGGTISGTGTVAFGAGTTQLQVNPTVSNLLIDGGSVSFTPTLNYFGNLSETSGVLTLSGTTPTITGSFTLTGAL